MRRVLIIALSLFFHYCIYTFYHWLFGLFGIDLQVIHYLAFIVFLTSLQFFYAIKQCTVDYLQ